MEKELMRTNNMTLETFETFTIRLACGFAFVVLCLLLVVLLLLVAGFAGSIFGLNSEPKTFSSPGEASDVLFQAVQNTDEPSLEAILGAGKEVAGRRSFKSSRACCTEDWVVCKRLLDAGCQVLMPWAAPIGTGQGPRNPTAMRELRKRVPNIPLIVDAGIGLPSHACQVMEWGFDAVLVNTAVSRASDPITMARAFADAVRAGRSAFLAGPMIAQELAVPSTPEFGRPFSSDSAVMADSQVGIRGL